MTKRKFFIWSGGVIFLILLTAGGLILRTLVFAGQFTPINPHFSGNCRAVAGVTGAEDIEIDPVNAIAYISATDRRAAAAGKPVNGALYRLNLSDPEAEPIPLWRGEGEGDFRPHGISLYRSGDGKQRLFVINHPADGRHMVELFDSVDGWLTHVESISDPLFVSPNDLAAAGMRAFYIGNDVVSQNPVMKLLETLLPLHLANLIYFDGEKASVAAADIAFANGVALSNDGRRLFLAEMMDRNLRVYDRNAMTGALALADTIRLGSFPDNLSADADNAIWIGSHPRLADVMAHASDPAAKAPSQVLKVTPIPNARARQEEIYLNAGEQISAVSVAARHNKHLLLGPVFDSGILVCELP